MDILLYKDGRLAISESPLEGKENNLDDVVMLVTNPQDGDTLTYKNGKWVNGEGGGSGGFAPDITNPQDGDTLVYNATAGKWVNGSGGGGGLVVHEVYDKSTETASLDKTWQEIYDAVMAGANVSFIHEDPAEQYALNGLSGIGRDNLEYYVVVNEGADYYTDTPSGYPSFDPNK